METLRKIVKMERRLDKCPLFLCVSFASCSLFALIYTDRESDTVLRGFSRPGSFIGRNFNFFDLFCLIFSLFLSKEIPSFFLQKLKVVQTPLLYIRALLLDGGYKTIIRFIIDKNML